MKNNIKYIILLIAAMFALNAAAQNRAEWILSFDTLELKPVSLNGPTFYEIYMGEDFSKSASLGQANLPHYNKLIQIPEGKQIQIKHTVLEKDTVTIKENILIAPLQKSRLKQDNNRDFYFDKQYYNTDTFTGSNEVAVKHFGQMGKNNTAVISIAPLRYNPHKNMIERIKKIKTEIIFTPQSKSMGASAGKVHNQHPFKMVVLADDMFKQTLVPFIQWKTMQGFDITEVYTSQTGKNAEEIRSYLKDMYYAATQTSPAFDYLLIVGDTEQIPAFVGEYTIDNYPAHYTDLYYAEYTDDILPDVFYGRMSANDTSTLQNIIDKTLKYEKFLFDSNAFLNNSLLVAGRELGDNAPAFTNGQMNYTKQYLHPYTDTSVFYNPSSALPENRTAIRNRLNEGNSWVNYTGHCNYNGWQNPPYNIKDVDTALNNTERYGIFINNCCLSGKFDEKSCFTESLLRAKDKGAVAAIGASDYTLWDEDYYWSVGSKAVKEVPEYNHERMGMYDRFFHTYNQPYNERYVTAGQIIQAGNLAVMQSLSSYSD
ncbi:MAG: hypothetical protein IJ250_06280, partial [Bacteroidales bacterium]|nr:hypothetical protein [Bacteroidales bacterium]